MHRAIALALFAVLTTPALACIWTHGTDLRGEPVAFNNLSGEEMVRELRSFEPRARYEAYVAAHERKAKNQIDRQQRNDYAVALLHVGRTSDAIGELQALEREEPGRYITAVNLGTAYELAGDNARALQWIREGIRRNRNAHMGTEWLHVRILEAKAAMQRDPNWLKRNTVTGIDFGNKPIPKRAASLPRGNDGKPVSVEDLKQALYYQLDERYAFVGPPDAIVGSLLVEFANVLFRAETLESAIPIYREALRYGADPALVKQRIARAEQVLREAKARRK